MSTPSASMSNKDCQKPSQKPLYLVIAFALPVVFFLLLEGGLRLADFGQDEPLFIENPSHNDYLLARPDVIGRYFPEGYAPRVTLEPTFFLKDKPDNGFRIVVQGGSTAAGYPYGLGASLAGMLEHRLRRSLPEHHLEMVNVAMSAVNSHFLLDTADEIIEIEPDLVVIYAGHNEYLGIFGVGSSFTAFEQPKVMRSVLALRKVAIFDALQTFITKLQNPQPQTPSAPDSKTGDNSRRTLMSQVAKHKNIPFDSPLYHAGIAQFQQNMSALLDKYTEAGIPVVIATVASNIKDHQPFSSEAGPHSANSFYQQGLNALASGQVNTALGLLTKAKDCDLLRFRAPEVLNEKIKQLGQRDNVFVADVKRAMEQRSPQGLVGNNLMLEHLHPNVSGYFVLANSVYDAIRNADLVSPFNPINVNTAWRERPITVAEEYYGFAQVQKLMSDYPFTDTPKPLSLPTPADWQQQLGRAYFDGRTDWLTMMKQLRAGSRPRGDKALWLKITRLLAAALPHDGLINSQAMDALNELKRPHEAYYYEQRALRAGMVPLNTKQ